jgi:glutamyl-tRNA synthetase
MGFLPEAMRNYLVRLGWAHGDDEIMSLEQMIEWFDVDDVGRSASRFDFAKLENLNGHYMRAATDDALYTSFVETLPYLPGGEAMLARLTPERAAQLRSALPGLKERAKTLIELKDGAAFLFAERPLALDEKASTILDADARALLKDLHSVLLTVEWTVEATEEAVKAFAEAKGLKLGKVAQPLRAALTGRSTSPGIFDVLIVLGREESLGRIADQAKE